MSTSIASAKSRSRESTALYAAVAHATRQRVDWDQILRIYDTSTVQWKWLENARNFSIYTKQDAVSPRGFSVLSIGSVKASVPEVVALLRSANQREYEHTMAALHNAEFKHGTCIADVANELDAEPGKSANRLSVRSATFVKAGWLQRDDEWCFLEDTQYDREHQRFEKLVTTLRPEQVEFPSSSPKPKFGGSRHFRDVVAGYYVHPEEANDATCDSPPRVGGTTVRVHFYGELSTPPVRFGALSLPSAQRDASPSAMQQRLLQHAKACARLSVLVRRRRLGLQTLADQRRVVPHVNARCIKCEQVQFIAKACRVCGHSACGDCSDKYERETHVRTHMGQGVLSRLEMIRVCDPCLARVDAADYRLVGDASLAPVAVVADPVRKDHVARSAQVDLKELLHNALLQAPSPHRKSAVRSVIRCVLDQERAAYTDAELPLKTSAVSHTDSESTEDIVKALDGLVVPTIPHDRARLAGDDGRAYVLSRDYTTTYTPPENEHRRLAVLDDLDVLTSAPCDELDLICSLAAKEVGVFASIVSVITKDEFHVVAANNPQFKKLTTERAHSFCTHTIMDDKPLVIAHPEADVRVSYTKVATTLGARFYCGFPLVVDDDNSVVGSLCCLDQNMHELTESQFTTMTRLAQTAAKIIRVRGEQRRRASRGAAPASPGTDKGYDADAMP